jgi:two-component system, NarL family, invasion response regulator UvrY
MKSILHADDHPMMRTGLRKIIEGFLTDVSFDEAFDGNSTFEKVKKKDYDLVILDVSMPGTDSFGLVSNILALKPGTKILMFSLHVEEVFAKKYFQSGAMGYINKDASIDEIEQAVNKVFNNERYISPLLTQLLTDEAIGKVSPNPFDKLSVREFEFVQHLLDGESMAGISKILNLHPSTISSFKSKIFKKLNCESLNALFKLAKEYKIISDV